MDPLSGAASVIAVIQLTGNIVQICGKYLGSVKDATHDVQRFQEKIAALASVLQYLDGLNRESDGKKLTATQELANNIAKCFSALTRLKDRIEPKMAQKGMRKWGLRAFKWPLERSEADDVITELEWYKTTIALSLQVDQTCSTNSISQTLDISRIQTAKGATFDSYDNQHSECLPGTRIDLLRKIDEWANSPHGKCIFWLNGMAGTGKSTISRTVASHLKEQHLLGASFFFKRGEEDRGTAKKLFPTLTEQLVISIPQILPSVRKAIGVDPNISEKVLREQFEKLLLDPLLGIEQREERITRVIVIDALDECESEYDIEVILQLLPQVQKSNVVQLRFLLTSRPELPIRLGFEGITDVYQDLVLHEIDQPVIEHDITLYFEDQFRRLKQKRSLPPDWPGDAATKELVYRAVPLFIAAATLCRFIGDANWSPQKRLKMILADRSIYVSKMDSTYIPVLNHLLTGQNEAESQQLLEEFKEIVGVIIILATPLSIGSLSRLIDREPDDVKCRLDQLHSVLSVPNDFNTPARLLHLSFRDFLLDHHSDKSGFWIDKKHVNQRITARCIQTLQHSLRKNICNLPSQGTQRHEIDRSLIRHHIPPELKYACRYWATHLVQSHDPVKALIEAFPYLEKHFLHWLEAMSILGYMSEVVVTIKTLELLVTGDTYSEIAGFLYDARRFVLKNRQMADAAPLQLYSSGLMFAPKNSTIRRNFQSELATWGQLPSVEETWSSELQILEGHSDFVHSVAFSPDSQLLASGSSDETVQLWDARTGEVRQTLKGHLTVRCVAFSPNNQLLASGSDDNAIRLWNVSTGEMHQTLRGHSGSVWFVAFSVDGQLLASGSCDRNIRLWDTRTWEMRKICGTHSGSVRSVAFSPGGQLLASGSDDKTVKVWDTRTGELRQTLEGHSGSVESVAFSRDGQLLVSGSYDETIWLWDTSTGKMRQILKGHYRSVQSVSFSPDSPLLASGSCDGTVRFWDTGTGELLHTLVGHSDFVRSVAFSPDGQLLATGSDDKSVRFWDTSIGEVRHTLDSHSGSVWSVAFSPDGQLLASGSSDMTVWLWDTSKGELLQTLEGHSDCVQSVAFSPDGRLLASGSYDKTVRLWDTSNGELLQTLEGHSNFVRSVAFSPDGQLLASGSYDKTVRLWDTGTGELLQSLEVHSNFVRSVAFSPNGQLLVSGSDDKTVQLWDIRTGEMRRALKGHPESVCSVSFSPDGQLLASVSDDNTVRLWDINTGALHQTLKGHSDWVWSEANIGLSILNRQWVSFREQVL